MSKEEEIRMLVTAMLNHICPDYRDCQKIAEKILTDVIVDIEETADEDFNDCDVRLAITRVLKRKLGIEDY